MDEERGGGYDGAGRDVKTFIVESFVRIGAPETMGEACGMTKPFVHHSCEIRSIFQGLKSRGLVATQHNSGKFLLQFGVDEWI